MSEAEKGKRVQLDFSGPAAETLDDLKKKMGASSRAEVVRYALGLLEQVQGHRVILADDNKLEKELVLPAGMRKAASGLPQEEPKPFSIPHDVIEKIAGNIKKDL